MNKLAIQETFPPGIVGRDIVLAQMCHHYRRISSAKARVDTNLYKPPKTSLSRPLSAEVASIVQRSLSPRSPPKHRRCLKYEHEMGEHHIKPSVRSQTAESRLRATPEVYHPAVKSTKPHHQEFDGQQQGTQTSPRPLVEEEEEPKTRDEAIQTVPLGQYRPLDGRSVRFLRDITNDALHRRAFTSSALNRIFLDHQFRNAYGLSQELMERELEELRRQLRMLPRHQREGSTVSDAEALDALDSLVLDPRIKEQVIHSLRLSRANDVKKTTYSYFDRLKFDEEDELPMRDQTSNKLRETLSAVESFGTANGSIEQVDEIPLDQEQADRMLGTSDNLETDPADGWNADIEEEDRVVTSASSSKDEEDEEYKESDVEEEEEVVESLADSDEEQSSANTKSDVEIEEVTQIESTSKLVTEERTDSKTQERSTNSANNSYQTDDAMSRKNNTEVSTITSEDMEAEETQSFLKTLKLEPTTKGDKWRSSLEVVKEEPYSTGQVSDISTASTPTEGESKQVNVKVLSPTATRSNNTQSSATYHLEECGEHQQGETESTGDTESAASSRTQFDTTTSTGGEIVLQMNDLLADTESTHETENVGMKATITQSDNVSKEQKEVKQKGGDEEDETSSDSGSAAESVDAEEDESSHSKFGSESDTESVHTD